MSTPRLPFGGKRHRRRTTKYRLYGRVSPALLARLNEVRDIEKRYLPDVVGAMILLGLGVYNRLREHPSINKGWIYEEKAELIMLADFQIAEQIHGVERDTAEAIVARNFRFSERSDYY